MVAVTTTTLSWGQRIWNLTCSGWFGNKGCYIHDGRKAIQGDVYSQVLGQLEEKAYLNAVGSI